MLLAAAARRGEPLPEPDAADGVGARAPRYDADELALGDKPFVGDMTGAGDAPRRAALLRSSARARAAASTRARRRRIPGVVAVLTAADVPGERMRRAR